MNMTRITFSARSLLTLVGWLAIASIALGQESVTRSERSQLSPTSSSASQYFGTSIAMDSGVAAVGASGASSNAGSVTVFERGSSNAWNLISTLVPGDLAANDEFGISVALDGDIIVAGAPQGSGGTSVDQGAAYVFANNGSSWVQIAKLTADDGAASAEFGASVAIKGDMIAIGAPNASNNGATYVFQNTSGSTWTQVAKLVASNGVAGDRFGSSVAMGSSKVLVGAPSRDAQSGAAYLFRKSGASWIQAVQFASAEFGASAFGSAVALSSYFADDFAYVGAPDALNSGNASGAAFVFRRVSDVSWPLEARLIIPDGQAGDGFGATLAAYDDRVAVAAPTDTVQSVADAGSVTVFRRVSSSVWQASAKLAAATGSANGSFGEGVAIAGERVIVGAPTTNNANADRGIAFVFKISTSKPSSNSNSRDDLFWFNPTAGKVQYWAMDGLVRESAGTVASALGATYEYNGVGDFYGDGRSSVLMRDKSTGGLRMQRVSGTTVIADTTLASTLSWSWRFLANADLSGDGRADIIFRNVNSGALKIWVMNGATKEIKGNAGSSVGLEYLASADIDGDGRSDILWRNSAGVVLAWKMSGIELTSVVSITGVSAVPTNWIIAGTGDLDGDLDSDLLWRDVATGTLSAWMMNGVNAVVSTITTRSNTWRVECLCDLDGDGDDDIVWSNRLTADVQGWLMSGTVKSSSAFIRKRGVSWSCLNDDDFNDDHGHDGNGNDDDHDDDNSDDWNDDHGGSDSDDSSSGGGNESVSTVAFTNSIAAALAVSNLPILEVEAEHEGSADYVEVLQWNAATAKLTRVVVNSSTLAVVSNSSWTPSSAEFSSHEDEIDVLSEVTVAASTALAQAMASRPTSAPHAIELESEDLGPVWKIEVVASDGSTSEVQVPAS